MSGHSLHFGAKECGCVWMFCDEGCEPEEIMAALGLTMNQARCVEHQQPEPDIDPLERALRAENDEASA